MISFANDYSEACAAPILEELARTRTQQFPGYGEDDYCASAAELIRQKFSCPSAAVHFLVGGTQTNLVMIAQVLRPHEGVICVNTGHVHVHETGAIEAAGHKLLVQEGEDGKLTAACLDQVMSTYWNDPTFEHMVKPKLVYISDTTELGTLYSQAELAALRQVADAWDLYIYLDGARLGSALTSPKNDLEPKDLALYCDAFSIGGTKNGLLFGEALVIVNPELQKEFRFIQKQRGALLAKGWLIGLQYQVIFQDDLYFDLADHANQLALKLGRGLEDLGLKLATEAQSNQIFVYLPNSWLEPLAADFNFEIQSPQEDRALVRLCTSWATPESNVDQFLAACKKLAAK